MNKYTWYELIANVELPAINKEVFGLNSDQVKEFSTKDAVDLLTDEQILSWIWLNNEFIAEADESGMWKKPAVNRTEENYISIKLPDLGIGYKHDSSSGMLSMKRSHAKIILSDEFIGTLANEGEDTECIDGIRLPTHWTNYVTKCLEKNGADHAVYAEYIESLMDLATEEYRERIETRIRLTGEELVRAVEATPTTSELIHKIRSGLMSMEDLAGMFGAEGSFPSENPGDSQKFG